MLPIGVKKSWPSVLLVTLIGATSGACFELNRLPYGSDGFDGTSFLVPVALSAAAFTALLLGLRAVAHALLARSALPEAVKERYPKYDAFCYLPLLVFGLGAFGVRFPFPTTPVLLALALVFAHAALVYFLSDADRRARALSSFQWLSFLFFLSGFAALIYQIVWQRVLFGLFGVNIESVTITVSLFMLGLGVGSLVGGRLSERFPARAPQLFLLCELGIGLFGVFSIPLIKSVGEATLHGSPVTVSLATYALLSLPTMGMGATLPILVGYLNRHYGNVGKSVGVLYFINTLGSAVACFITADLLFVFLGLQAAVLFAAVCNLLVAVLVYGYCRRVAKAGGDTPPAPAPAAVERPGPAAASRPEFVLALVLAGATGYISLSQEILWFRAVSYITGGKPDVFAYILGFFLFGIALGALLAKRVCEAGRRYALPFVAIALALSGVFYEFSLPLSAKALTLSPTGGLYACYLAVAAVALLIGSAFPVVCHYGIEGRAKAGLLLSWVYFANILGATAGPLLTGFVLLDLFSLGQNCALLSAATVALAGGVALFCLPRPALRLGGVAAAGVAMAALLLAQPGLYADLLEKLHYKALYPERQPYRYVVENRSGIIAVAPADPDIIFGGGAYDGRFNVDPVGNTNLIRRGYMMAALHPDPAEVLEIGLSSGSWAEVVAEHESVRKLTIVEINPGYLGLLDKYPEVATLPDDPKVTIVIDDGRRWLHRNADARFDFILMNTSQHWRDHVTNILSVEFLQLVKAHLKPGGVAYLNMTGSDDIALTAATVFKHVTCYNSFVAMSDAPFAMTPAEKRANLLKFRRAGYPVFDSSPPELAAVLDELATADTTDKAPRLRARHDLWVITDDNMATEYKTTNKWFKRDERWGSWLAGWVAGRLKPRAG